MNLLTIKKPLVINPKLAERIGLNEAIVLQQLSYWIGNPNSGVEADGYKWVYNTYKDWQEQMPFFSERTIQRAVLNLEKKGIVLSDMLNKSRGDRTKFYAIDYSHEALIDDSPNAKVALPSRQNGTTAHSAKVALPSRQNGTLSTEISTENTTKTTSDTCANRTKSDFINSEFERFWAEYPVKKGKAAASKTWKRKKLYEQTDFLINDVLNRVQFDSQWQNVKYIPHGSTYLNQETWQDEIQQSVNQPSNQQLSAVDRIRQNAMQQYPELFEQPSDGVSMGSNGRDIWPEVD